MGKRAATEAASGSPRRDMRPLKISARVPSPPHDGGVGVEVEGATAVCASPRRAVTRTSARELPVGEGVGMVGARRTARGARGRFAGGTTSAGEHGRGVALGRLHAATLPAAGFTSTNRRLFAFEGSDQRLPGAGTRRGCGRAPR